MGICARVLNSQAIKNNISFAARILIGRDNFLLIHAVAFILRTFNHRAPSIAPRICFFIDIGIKTRSRFLLRDHFSKRKRDLRNRSLPSSPLTPDRSSSFYRSLFINSRNSDFARLKIISNSESRIYYWPSVKKLEIRLIDEYPCLQGIITNSCRKWRGWTILLVAGLDMILLGSCLCQMVKRSRRAFFLDLPRL